MALKLTQEEEQLILIKRAQDEDAKPKKIGELKEDLYINNSRDNNGDVAIDVPWYCSTSEKDEAISDFVDSFEKIGAAGDIFDCYIGTGEDRWYDREYGVEGMDAEWAENHLTNIKILR